MADSQKEEKNQPDSKKLEFKIFIILLYTPLALTILRYYGSAEFYSDYISSSAGPQNQYYYFLASLVILGIIPILISTLGFKMRLTAIGLGIGDFKKVIFFIVIGLPLIILLTYLSSKNPSFIAEYPLHRTLLTGQNRLLVYFLIYGLYYIGWEIFFRGFMLFSLREHFGDTTSILIQTIPSCLMHIGKPDIEIFASIIAGLVFGWVVLRCRSIWPAFICHWGLGVFLDIFIIYG
jgi:membrane protease YdiL (CAAX protease family)